ncbi:MAG: glycosyltransferase family 2 protein [bacterium]
MRISKMKIAALMIIRDEETFIEWNIRYHLQLGFDYIFITNHCSIDNTKIILKKFSDYKNIIAIEESEPTFDHGKIANKLLQFAIKQYDIDWFFLIDADEFLSIPTKIHPFIENLEKRKIIYASIGWVNAIVQDKTSTPNPIATSMFYYPFPEREWQHEGHFRKSIAKNHDGIEIVVGGHYFKSENNKEFYELAGGSPVILPFSEAKYFHFENRNNAYNLFKKWERLALNEQDSSSNENAPWLERINLIRKYVREYKENIEELERLWFKEARTLWGTKIPNENIFSDTSLSDWSKLIEI